MAKRSKDKFERAKGDFYRTTDERAVLPLIPHLPPESRYVEPCAGQGDLMDLLEKHGHVCTMAFDQLPQRGDIMEGNALVLNEVDVLGADFIITNPPWRRDLLHAMILRFIRFRPTWLLFDADWMHTEAAIPLLAHCSKIVSVGRVRWMQGTKMDGFDNAAWYLFESFTGRQGPVFIPRSAEICAKGRIVLSMNRAKSAKTVSTQSK